MQLIVCSPSTKRYIKDFQYDDIMIVTEPPTKDTLKLRDRYHNVIAIGGGSVIDTAKIICMNSIIAVPTTYSGASGTSHSVYWHNEKKCNIKTKLPMTIIKEKYARNLPKSVEATSKVDCMSHVIESLVSKNSTEESDKLCMKSIKLIKDGDWLNASVMAGRAIEITGTNLIHGLSYGITGKYKIPHGIALSYILNLSDEYKKVKELL